jgi:HlyD family secretion protein
LAGKEDQPLEALLYVPASQGKQAQPGMTVNIEPSVIRREEYGVVRAKVLSVADFPSTRHGMMRALDNEEMVANFLKATRGAPIAVRVSLDIDSDSFSGYRWSSGKGPNLQLSSGTPCSATITTKTQRPISLLFPYLRKMTGV